MTNMKLRLKHPSGAEFEAEGPAEFIISEKEGFLRRLTGAQGEPPEIAADGIWGRITASKHGLVTLKNKHQGLKAGEAALLLLAAERQLSKAAEVAAIALSKAVKASGYAPERLDRVLAKAMKEGLVRASGTKRNRSYNITDRGLERAWMEARKLG